MLRWWKLATWKHLDVSTFPWRCFLPANLGKTAAMWILSCATAETSVSPLLPHFSFSTYGGGFQRWWQRPHKASVLLAPLKLYVFFCQWWFSPISQASILLKFSYVHWPCLHKTFYPQVDGLHPFYTPRVCTGPDHFETFYLSLTWSKRSIVIVQLLILILFFCLIYKIYTCYLYWIRQCTIWPRTIRPCTSKPEN